MQNSSVKSIPMKLRSVFFVAAVIGSLAGCASPKPEDYASNKPTLDLRNYMNGDIDAYGMFIDRSGEAKPMFHCALHGSWQGNIGKLTEHFEYNDGRKQDREWSITFTDDHHFTGTAPDVIGTAVGSQFGNAAMMSYVLTVTTEDGDSHDMDMTDWLYMMNNEVVVNRNVMNKFGFNAGELIITFRKKLPEKLASKP